jgi:RNA polymerase sigma-70 factor (ECF subfamily)
MAFDSSFTPAVAPCILSSRTGMPRATPHRIAAAATGARVLAPRAPNRSLAVMDQPVAAPTDEALMLAWAGGDAAAFDSLYARHRGPLFRFMLGQLRDRPLAEELYQDVWQRVIAARVGWRPDAAFATWLYRIAHNRLNDHWRAQRHRPPAPVDADLRTAALADPDDPEGLASREETRRRLQEALDELPEDQREAVLLRLQQELSLDEIGRITGVGRETVKSRLRYALDKLRARLNP